MGKRHIKSLKKQKKHQKAQQKMLCSKTTNSKELKIELNSTLSKGGYRQYYIVSNDEKIGYLGVYSNGVFFHSIIADGYDNDEILLIIKDFIKNELNLTPIKH